MPFWLIGIFQQGLNVSVLKFEHKPVAGTSSRLAGRMPSVDGWRALSIMMVLAAHSTEKPGFSNTWREIAAYFPLLFNGNLGVRFFFVISGFLITYLLIKEHERNGRVSLRKFFIRRALRILPVYLVYLAVIATLQFFTELHQAPITWIGDLTFTVNFLPRGVISGHLWSLSVEEQFYLLWPITFVWLNKQKQFVYWIFAIPIVVAILCHIVSYTNNVPWIVHPLFHQHSSLVNFDSLDVGCIAAFGLAKIENVIAGLLSGKKRFAAIMFGILLIVTPSLNVPFLSPIWSAIGNLMQAIGFGVLLVTSVLYPGSFKPLNWPIVVQLGVVSYSIYIWQQIFFAGPQTYGFPSAWWMSFPWWLLAALTAGFASYYGFERPLLKLRTRFRRN
jgi:peptidoglycan/LPS O-acetylase OafA/YrhL